MRPREVVSLYGPSGNQSDEKADINAARADIRPEKDRMDVAKR